MLFPGFIERVAADWGAIRRTFSETVEITDVPIGDMSLIEFREILARRFFTVLNSCGATVGTIPHTYYRMLHMTSSFHDFKEADWPAYVEIVWEGVSVPLPQFTVRKYKEWEGRETALRLDTHFPKVRYVWDPRGPDVGSRRVHEDLSALWDLNHSKEGKLVEMAKTKGTTVPEPPSIHAVLEQWNGDLARLRWDVDELVSYGDVREATAVIGWMEYPLLARVVRVMASTAVKNVVKCGTMHIEEIGSLLPCDHEVEGPWDFKRRVLGGLPRNAFRYVCEMSADGVRSYFGILIPALAHVEREMRRTFEESRGKQVILSTMTWDLQEKNYTDHKEWLELTGINAYRILEGKLDDALAELGRPSDNWAEKFEGLFKAAVFINRHQWIPPVGKWNDADAIAELDWVTDRGQIELPDGLFYDHPDSDRVHVIKFIELFPMRMSWDDIRRVRSALLLKKSTRVSTTDTAVMNVSEEGEGEFPPDAPRLPGPPTGTGMPVTRPSVPSELPGSPTGSTEFGVSAADPVGPPGSPRVPVTSPSVPPVPPSSPTGTGVPPHTPPASPTGSPGTSVSAAVPVVPPAVNPLTTGPFRLDDDDDMMLYGDVFFRSPTGTVVPIGRIKSRDSAVGSGTPVSSSDTPSVVGTSPPGTPRGI